MTFSYHTFSICSDLHSWLVEDRTERGPVRPEDETLMSEKRSFSKLWWYIISSNIYRVAKHLVCSGI